MVANSGRMSRKAHQLTSSGSMVPCTRVMTMGTVTATQAAL
jgi:hypothetical protein